MKGYIDDKIHETIMGIEPIESWDNVIDELKKMNVDRLIEIHQEALDRIK